MRVNRYVLDANVWVSYIITRTQDKLLYQVAEGNLTIFTCNELLNELRRVFNYPQLKKYEIDIRAAMGFVKGISVNHELAYPIKSYIPDDPEDDYLVALALQTNSGFITSGDRHILSEKKRLEARFKKLQILTKAEFEKRIMRR